MRVGVCGIGLAAYWPQFKGLRTRLESYVRQATTRLEHFDVIVEPLGMVDTPQRGWEAGHACRRADIDLLVIYITTYALSSAVLPMVRLAQVPVLILNLQPDLAIDYETFNRLPDRISMTGEWLAFCSSCSAPEIANVLLRAGIQFHQVAGSLYDENTWDEIKSWIEAAKATTSMKSNRLGLLGHYYNGMLDMMTDLVQVSILFGCQIEHLEVDELSYLCQRVSDEEIADRVRDFHSEFDIQKDCSPHELQRAARTSKALDRFVETHSLNSLAYYYKGTGVSVNESVMSSIILGTSLLTARGVPVAGEYDVKNALAMKIINDLNAGGSFTEYYALDLKQDCVLMGHDGPGHLAIAENKSKVRPLTTYHGKVGRGLSVEMNVKPGDVTLLSVTEDSRHGFKFVVAEGESVCEEILRIGNTNSHYRFPIGALGFVEAWNMQGPSHHCAIGVGHIAHKLDKVARLMKVGFVQIC